MVSSANNFIMSGGGPGGGVVLTSKMYNLGDRDMAAGPIRKQTSAQHDLLRHAAAHPERGGGCGLEHRSSVGISAR
ncbi:hypothetical protein DL766_001750 [Monosporascus sp. MC13-8B]|nr:hypothetical protein DL763_001453 [Monosporascus cannonballus]RYP36872.1 hypothetical protein DL766_001750 [Monosporascus sp. MC13-8B]